MSPWTPRNIKANSPTVPDERHATSGRFTQPPCGRVAHTLETPVCNPVCTSPGHNVALPGTPWHNREVPMLPQEPTYGTPWHNLTLRGTTWHNRGSRFNSCRAYQPSPRVWARIGDFEAISVSPGASVQCSVHLVWSQPGTRWHNVARPGTAIGRRR